MPKIDYPRNAVVYKISSNQCDDIYIGCHADNCSLEDRLNVHRDAYIRWMDGEAGYCTSFYIMLHDGYKIELIERGARDKKQMNLRWIFWRIANCCYE